ncbi:hypothetical protein CDAR_277381 [Caerostris darwini]|uniref:Uncharacterized protein n=1 Tax=Caerostris darwini TaxID=1538125 RepID=A0AAV4VTH3_9ARAC|nr:hypothetical protein CDAR_277381 [Caerostris darwini]
MYDFDVLNLMLNSLDILLIAACLGAKVRQEVKQKPSASKAVRKHLLNGVQTQPPFFSEGLGQILYIAANVMTIAVCLRLESSSLQGWTVPATHTESMAIHFPIPRNVVCRVEVTKRFPGIKKEGGVVHHLIPIRNALRVSPGGNPFFSFLPFDHPSPSRRCRNRFLSIWAI